MARTKIAKISPANVALARKTGLVMESAKSYVVLAGTPAEALAALRAVVEEKPALIADKGEEAAFRTLVRKLEDGKPEYVKVLDDAPAEELVLQGQIPGHTADADGVHAGRRTLDDASVPVVLAPVVSLRAELAAENRPAEQAEPPAEEPKVKARKTPAELAASLRERGKLPEGYVSVMGLTHEINARSLYQGNRADGQLTGQSLYTYIKANGPDSAHPFPFQKIDGAAAIPLEEGIAWWIAKNERAAARKAARDAMAAAS